jgi:CheY-like chemotaxis protein
MPTEKVFPVSGDMRLARLLKQCDASIRGDVEWPGFRRRSPGAHEIASVIGRRRTHDSRRAQRAISRGCERVKRAKRRTTAVPVARRSRNMLGGATILVVEDHEDSRELFRAMLECHGAIVTSAASVDEAKRVLEIVRPHVILTDIGLRPKPGTWLREDLRQSTRFASIPVVAVTGREVPQSIVAMFDGFLRKPVDVDELCALMLRLLSRRRAG